MANAVGEGICKLEVDDLLIVTSDHSSTELVRSIQDALKTRSGGTECRVIDYNDLQQVENLSKKICVCLLELDHETLSHLSEGIFVKRIFKIREERAQGALFSCKHSSMQNLSMKT